MARPLHGVRDSCVFALDAGLHDAGMAEDKDARCADEPEECAERGGPPQEGDTDDEERGVEGLLRDELVTYLHRLRCCCEGGVSGGEGDERGRSVPNLLMAVNPPMRKPSEMSRRTFVMSAYTARTPTMTP